MKITYKRNHEVQTAFDRINSENDNINIGPDRNKKLKTLEEDSEVELEIDFDPPQAPIRLAPGQEPPFISTQATRSYNIRSRVLSSVLDWHVRQLRASGQRVTTLYLNKVDLTEEEEEEGQIDQVDFLRTTSTLTELRSVVANTCMIHPDAWLQRLSQLPHLQSVTFENIQDISNVLRGEEDPRLPTFPAITRFLQLRFDTLLALDIDNIALFSSHFDKENFFQAVGACTHLKRLNCNMDCSEYVQGYTERQASSIANLIQTNSSLQDFRIVVENHVSLVPMAQSLARNTTLQTLELSVPTFLEMDDILSDGKELTKEVFAFRDTLATKNFHLRTLKVIDSTYIGDRGPDHHLHRWEQGYTFIKGDDDCEAYWAALNSVAFFLDLNRLGRSRILRGHEADFQEFAPRADWVRMVVENHDNPTVVYYYLRLNLSMYFF